MIFCELTLAIYKPPTGEEKYELILVVSPSQLDGAKE
jgi:hypothetical protein